MGSLATLGRNNPENKNRTQKRAFAKPQEILKNIIIAIGIGIGIVLIVVGIFAL